jgi:2-hydroxy-3-keto-5-methylthiopentenyl-1-phosphate phosphatase
MNSKNLSTPVPYDQRKSFRNEPEESIIHNANPNEIMDIYHCYVALERTIDAFDSALIYTPYSLPVRVSDSVSAITAGKIMSQEFVRDLLLASLERNNVCYSPLSSLHSIYELWFDSVYCCARTE